MSAPPRHGPLPLPARRLAVWDLGFRPFYLAASVFAAVSVPLWALQLSGWLGEGYVASQQWHGHEMLFGFATAVIVGFLFTAGRNWSRQPTPTGRALQGLVLLWLAGRVLVATPWPVAAAIVNVAFPLAAAAGLAVPFVKAGLRRNYFFVGLLVLLAIAQGAVHLGYLRGMVLLPGSGLRIGLDVVLFVMAVIGGRVIPMFTNAGVPGANAERRLPVERVALGAVLALLAVDAANVGLPLAGAPVAAVALLAAAAHVARWLLWRPWRTLRAPLVWVLHAGYAWIPAHLLLRGLAELDVVAPNLATHALTVGAIGGLTIGMMTRTALGHTGRMLRAGPFEIAAYLAILAAALVRVGGPLLLPAGSYLATVQASAALWSAGFLLYATRYAPFLLRARPDGQPG